MCMHGLAYACIDLTGLHDQHELQKINTTGTQVTAVLAKQ